MISSTSQTTKDKPVAAATPNPLFAKFDAALGKTTPTVMDSGVSVKSRADQIRELAATATNVPTTNEGGDKGFMSNVAGDFNKRVNSAADAQVASIAGKESPLQATVHTIGEGAGMVSDVGGEAIKSLHSMAPNRDVEDAALANDPIVKLGAQAIKAGGDIWDSFSHAHPKAADYLSSIGNIASVVPIGGGVKSVAKGAEDVAKVGTAGAQALKDVPAAVKTVNSVANAANDAKNVDKLAGAIVQGKSTDIAKAKIALSSIDPTKIKTYKDLSDALSEKIGNVSNKLDESLSTNTNTKPLSELNLTSKVGDSEVAHNYVEDSLTQLKDHYKATNDIPALTKVEQIESKAKDTGLTIKEINDLAKEHGRTLNAFNANGQAASGLTKQAAENTRTGLKSTARELFDNPVYKETDSQTTAMIRTRDLADKMTEEVNKLQQKIKERTLGEKAGRLAGTALNLIGMNSPKGFIEYFLGRGTGLKTLNALDLESGLQKNLKSLQTILKPGIDESTIEQKLQEIIDGAKKKQ